ncbi:MAG: uroporphyrinogen decarboxylase family protein [Phycisphaerae bacterium]|nr:uroporphyrinogen decarboxylase family protein [Phycisphaerae bacterium]
MTSITSKERVRTCLAWQEPDRVPIQTYLTPEIHALLKAHFDPVPVHEALGVDFRGVGARYLGPIKKPHDDIVSYDVWGIGYKRVPNGTGGYYDEAWELPLAGLETMDDVAAYPWPDPAAHDYSKIAEQCDAFRDFAVCCGGAGTPDILNGVSRGRGMEHVMIDIATRDEVGMAIIQKHLEFEFEVSRRTLEAGRGRIDILCLGEDMGNQNGRMFSPKDFDEVFRPVLQRFIDLAHHYGARAMLHSCGDTHEIMPDLMNMGLDILDAMQPEPHGMNPEKIRALCKGRLAFCGLISTQATLPFGTVADCRREARHRLDVIAPGGGYIFAPAHCIQAGTPLANVLAVYEEALGRRLG